MPDIDFTQKEQQCVDRCVGRALNVNKVLERHIDEQFNPVFVSKYLE